MKFQAVVGCRAHLSTRNISIDTNFTIKKSCLINLDDQFLSRFGSLLCINGLDFSYPVDAKTIYKILKSMNSHHDMSTNCPKKTMFHLNIRRIKIYLWIFFYFVNFLNHQWKSKLSQYPSTYSITFLSWIDFPLKQNSNSAEKK